MAIQNMAYHQSLTWVNSRCAHNSHTIFSSAVTKSSVTVKVSPSDPNAAQNVCFCTRSLFAPSLLLPSNAFTKSQPVKQWRPVNAFQVGSPRCWLIACRWIVWAFSSLPVWKYSWELPKMEANAMPCINTSVSGLLMTMLLSQDLLM